MTTSDDYTVLAVAHIIDSGATETGDQIGVQVVDTQGRKCVILVPTTLSHEFMSRYQGGERTAHARLKQRGVDIPTRPAEGTVIQTFSYDMSRVQGPVMSSPLPEAFYPFLGQILVLWGALESQFNCILDALVEPSGGSRAKGFDERVKQWKKSSRNIFSGCANLINIFDRVAIEALDVAIDRNLMAHKDISCIMDGYGILAVAGRQYGRDYDKRFTLEQVQDLFYKMSSVNGQLFGVLLVGLTGVFHEELPQGEKVALIEFSKTIKR